MLILLTAVGVGFAYKFCLASRSANSQAAPRGFACWQNIAAVFKSSRKTSSCLALSLCSFYSLRREEDLNPRYSCEYSDVRDHPIQPLWHPALCNKFTVIVVKKRGFVKNYSLKINKNTAFKSGIFVFVDPGGIGPPSFPCHGNTLPLSHGPVIKFLVLNYNFNFLFLNF